MIIIVFWLLLFYGLFIFYRYNKYKKSSYRAASGNTFLETVNNKGNYGEYLTFSYLEKLKDYHKLMTNLYIPKEDGTTTEIDLIMLSETGIYVLESKNYSGWIFGDERQKYWTQTFPRGQKYRFFNPIWQNKAHIKALNTVLKLDNDSVYKSYIIFSERCTIKNVNFYSPNVKVINRDDLIKIIKKDIEESEKIFTVEEINNLYFKLMKYTHAKDALKKDHIDNIKMKRLNR